MKFFKQIISLIVIVASVVSFSGCSLKMSSFDNLVRPPKLSGKYQGLQDSFEEVVGTDFDLKTPENGDYQSAFITYDCDSDGNEEAIVFYSSKEKNDVIKFWYFEYENEKWKPVQQFDGLGSSVDQVIFSDLNIDGNFEIIIGWSLFDSKTNKVFAVYEISNEVITAFPSNPYSFIDIIDVNGDGFDDIFTLSVDSTVPEQLSAYARIYNISNNSSELKMLGEVKTDGNISSYSSVSLEKEDEYNLIYIEANKGEHEMITELVFWDDETNSLVAPLFDVSSQSTKLTWRNNRAVSFDVDGDKFLEIPTSVEMNGTDISVTQSVSRANAATTSDINANMLYYTKWVKYRDSKLKPIQYSIINETGGYMLNIQSSWVGRITVVGVDGQWGFYRWDSSSSRRGDLLFSINFYDKTVSGSRKTYDKYDSLGSNGNINYVYSITDAGLLFGVKEETLKSNFIITDFGG